MTTRTDIPRAAAAEAAATDAAPDADTQAAARAQEMRALTQRLRQRPDDAGALHRLAILTHQAGRTVPAVALLRRAASAATRARRASILSDLGALLGLCGENADAVVALKEACALDRRNAAPWHNLGTNLARVGDYRGAVDAFARAARLAPEDPDSSEGEAINLLNIAGYARANDRFVATAKRMTAAAYPRTRIAEAWHSAALSRFLIGRLADGWALYDWRLETEWFDAYEIGGEALPYDGQELAGKRIAVLNEQGIGDHINFAGLIPDLLATGATVQVHTSERLIPLFQRSFPETETVALPPVRRGPLTLAPGVDFYAYAGSLCRWFRPNKAAFPQRSSYLRADPRTKARLAERYADGNLLVGLSWRTSNPANNHRRTLPLAQWEDILSLPGITFVNLQYGDAAAEIDVARARFGAKIVEDAEINPLADLDGFAAQVAALDLVVTIDNSTAHIAGALGVPTLLLLPALAEWRWFDEPEHSLWYSSVSLLRQQDIGDWAPVVKEVASRLRAASGLMPTASPTQNTPQEPSHPRVLLLNDTSEWYHWGCTGTSFALQRVIAALGHPLTTVPIAGLQALMPVPHDAEAFDSPIFFKTFRRQNRALVEKLAAADIVVVNGEGTLHGERGSVLLLLYLAYAAKRHLGKQVQIVNHSCFPPADAAIRALYRLVYANLDFVAVREPLSRQILQELGVEATLAFDSLPLFIAEHYRPREATAAAPNVVFAGSVAITPHHTAVFAEVARALARRGYAIKVLHGAAAYPAGEDTTFAQTLGDALPGLCETVEARSVTHWLETIERASCLISGRFHYNIAAASLGTPFVATTSNTHKMQAMLEMLNHAPAVPLGDPALGERLLAEAEAALASPRDPAAEAEVAEALQALALHNFDGLAALRQSAAAE